MTRDEALAFIIASWENEHPVKMIMMALICKGYPMPEHEIKEEIRKHLDSVSENRRHHGGVP